MKPLAIAAALQFVVLSLFAADTTRECSLCVGAVTDLTVVPATPVPLLAQIQQDDFATAGAALDAMPLSVRAHTTIVVGYSIDRDKDPLLEVESHTRTIVEWARLHGPIDGIGIAAGNAGGDLGGYAIKRLAVTAQGQNAAARIVLPPVPLETLSRLSESGALPYVDALLIDAPSVKATAAWIMEKDPAKKLWAIVAPQAPNAFFDLGRALADGASRAYLAQPADAAMLPSLAAFDRALIGEYAYDAAARIETLDARGNRIDEPVLAFVRGEDLRTIVIPRGDAAAATITSLPGDFYMHPRRVDAGGEKEISDVGRKSGRF